MAVSVNLKAKGLYDYPNTLGSVPEGAMTQAKNVVIDADGIVQPRRGFEPYGGEIDVGDDNDGISTINSYEDHLIISKGDTLGYDDGEGNIIEYPITYSAPSSSTKLRAVEANQNNYITSSLGILKQDSYTATPVAAGVGKALSGTAALTGTAGFLDDGYQVAYRMIWAYTDENNNLLLGPPSSRVIIGNSAGDGRNVELTFYIPDFVTTDYKFQVYRSKQSTVEPDDNMYLAIEGSVTSTDITNGYFTVVDILEDALLGAALYTSPSQEQIQNANDPPPFATEVAYYKNSVFYANTRSKQRFSFSLLATGSPSGLQVDDTIIIDGVTYTAKATEDASQGHFELFTSGTPGTNIENTARSLEKVINLYASNTTVYAYYVSNYEQAPGKLLLEERNINGAQFNVTSSRSDVWNPSLPSTGALAHSTNDVKPNGLYISKPNQPESVPVYSFLTAGSANRPIIGIRTLKDSIIVAKQNEGLFRVTGESFGNFTVQQFEPSTNVLVPDSMVVLNNRVHAYTSQGIVAVSTDGAEVLSRPIEGTLLRLATYPHFASASFGVAYESARQYWFFTVTRRTDTLATQAFVYNYFTGTWTTVAELQLEYVTAGIVNPTNDKLYLGGIEQEAA